MVNPMRGMFGYGVMMAVFAAASMWLAHSGWYTEPSGLPLTRLQIHIFGSLALFWIMYWTIPAFRSAVRGADLHALTAFQCFRVLGGAILVMWGYGLIPGGFALPMSILDISVGIMAFFTVLALHRLNDSALSLARSTHIWSLVDFAITIALALFAWRALPVDPPALASAQASVLELPLAAFPAVAIPVFSWVSFAALVRIKHLPKA